MRAKGSRGRSGSRRLFRTRLRRRAVPRQHHRDRRDELRGAGRSCNRRLTRALGLWRRSHRPPSTQGGSLPIASQFREPCRAEAAPTAVDRRARVSRSAGAICVTMPKAHVGRGFPPNRRSPAVAAVSGLLWKPKNFSSSGATIPTLGTGRAARIASPRRAAKYQTPIGANAQGDPATQQA